VDEWVGVGKAECDGMTGLDVPGRMVGRAHRGFHFQAPLWVVHPSGLHTNVSSVGAVMVVVVVWILEFLTFKVRHNLHLVDLLLPRLKVPIDALICITL